MSITALTRRIALLETAQQDQCPAWGMSALLAWAKAHPAPDEADGVDEQELTPFTALLAEARAWRDREARHGGV